jgi:hypothetical protein
MIRCVSENAFSNNNAINNPLHSSDYWITFMIKDVYVDITGDLFNLIENSDSSRFSFRKLFYENEFI